MIKNINSERDKLDILIENNLKINHNNFHKKISINSKKKSINDILLSIDEYYKKLNYFRNVGRKFIIDEKLSNKIISLNKKKFKSKLKNKKKFRIAWVINSFIDTGGVSFPHRYILSKKSCEKNNIDQYIFFNNLRNIGNIKNNSKYKYLQEFCHIKKFQVSAFNNNQLYQKGKEIEEWININQIDIAIIQSSSSGIYSIGSNPAPIMATIDTNWHSYSLGYGSGDINILLSNEQNFLYKFVHKKSENRLTNISMPLPSIKYINRCKKLDRESFNIPKKSILSLSTNIWKSTTGENQTLLNMLSILMKKNKNYHHAFIGTDRYYDHILNFLNNNKHMQKRVHFLGTITEIFSVLKMIDFYINSYPVSGFTNVEAAAVKIPSLDLVSTHRELNGHGPEFLNTNINIAFNVTEFILIGNKMIRDKKYRERIGLANQKKVLFDYNKENIMDNKFIPFLKSKYIEKCNKDKTIELNLESSLKYSKAISYFLAKIKNDDRKIQLNYLYKMIKIYPKKSFAYFKILQSSLYLQDKKNIEKIIDLYSKNKISDYRINFLLDINKYQDNTKMIIKKFKTYAIKFKNDKILINYINLYLGKNKLSKKNFLNRIPQLSYFSF